MAEGVEVAAGAELHDEAGVVRRLEVGVQRGQEGVVQGAEDLPLHLRAPELLAERQRVLVHHLHGVGARLVALGREAAEVDGADVAATDAPDE